MNKYAVWGNPIKQSKSPRIHALFAEQTGKQVNYVAKLGDEQEFEQQLITFFAEGAKGANITAPFKERAFTLADVHSEACLQAQACNTLIRLDDGRLYAENTDGLGLVFDLKRLGWLQPKQNILILGAGGATRGVLYPLLKAEQQITLYNRTTEKAAELAAQFAKFGDIHSACWETLSNQSFDLIINATSLGLQGKCVELPPKLMQTANIYDMQYAPAQQTPFLIYAQAQGATAVQDGLGMLVGQAAYAFEAWEGIFPNIAPVLAQLQSEIKNS